MCGSVITSSGVPNKAWLYKNEYVIPKSVMDALVEAATDPIEDEEDES